MASFEVPFSKETVRRTIDQYGLELNDTDKELANMNNAQHYKIETRTKIADTNYKFELERDRKMLRISYKKDYSKRQNFLHTTTVSFAVSI